MEFQVSILGKVLLISHDPITMALLPVNIPVDRPYITINITTILISPLRYPYSDHCHKSREVSCLCKGPCRNLIFILTIDSLTACWLKKKLKKIDNE